MDYKIVSEKYDDQGNIKEQVIRFYNGEKSVLSEYNPITDSIEPIERYRRIKMIEEVIYIYA